MIDENKLIQGERYFLMLYYDRDLKIPNIRTVIFIGKNVYGGTNDSVLDEWYFQDPRTYLEFGSFMTLTKSKKEKVKPEIISIDRKSLFSIHDLTGLLDKLQGINAK